MCLANQANSHPHQLIIRPPLATTTNAADHSSEDDDSHHSHHSHESYHSGLSSYSNDGSHRKSRSAVYELKPLADGFTPTDLDVICARGKEAYNHPGNARFRALVESQLGKYSNSTTKMEKSKIVRDIILSVRKASPQGGFVKKVKGVWMDVGERSAREKTGQQIRDLLHTQYRSSTKAKARTRQQLKGSQTTDKASPRIASSKSMPPLPSRAFPIQKIELKQTPPNEPLSMPSLERSRAPLAAARPPVIPGWRQQQQHHQHQAKPRPLYSEPLRQSQSRPPFHPPFESSYQHQHQHGADVQEETFPHSNSSSAFAPIAASRWTTSVAAAAHHQEANIMPISGIHAPAPRRASTFSDFGFDDLEPLPVDPSSLSYIMKDHEDAMDASASSLMSEDPFEEAIEQLYGYPLPPPPPPPPSSASVRQPPTQGQRQS